MIYLAVLAVAGTTLLEEEWSHQLWGEKNWELLRENLTCCKHTDLEQFLHFFTANSVHIVCPVDHKTEDYQSYFF